MSGERGQAKGASAEEALRGYFLKTGYFVVRGAKYCYEIEEVSDVDLWLYIRATPMTRIRANVDIKAKRKRARSLERILWAKGLQSILGLEQSIVATSDKQEFVKGFGVEHDVLVLDGHFVDRLTKLDPMLPVPRLEEEQLEDLLPKGDSALVHEQWSARYEKAKSRVLEQLNFDGCNAWLDDIRFFFERMVEHRLTEGAARLAYACIGQFLIGVDYSLRAVTFDEPHIRRGLLQEGFTYGSRGKEGTKLSLALAGELAAIDSGRSGNQLALRFQEKLEAAPAGILADFFSKTEVASTLFSRACRFEAHAYGATFIPPSRLEADLQAVLGTLLDYLRLDRRGVFEAL